eukprot:387-Prymnesium_polylepis.1
MPDLSQLAPGFRDGVTDLKRRVLSAGRAKTLGGTPLTGEMFHSLALLYVTAINEGAVPTISTAWQARRDRAHKPHRHPVSPHSLPWRSRRGVVRVTERRQRRVRQGCAGGDAAVHRRRARGRHG